MTDEPTDGASPSSEPAAPPAVAVPHDEPPAGRCPYCGWPFRTERLLHLHVGEVHAAEATDAERVASEAAREDESDDLFVLHLKVVAALVATYLGFAYLYTLVLA